MFRKRLSLVLKFPGQEMGTEAQCLGSNKEVHCSPWGNTVGCLPNVHSSNILDKTPMLHRVAMFLTPGDKISQPLSS